jgi:CubicO group peptidase (beta-lactamase class C family)
MTLTKNNIVAWHGATSSEHVAKRDDFAGKGFRPLSLSLYGTPGAPLYAAVMVKRPVVIATKSFINLTQAGYQDAFEQMSSEGFGPFIITATGPKDSALFAGSFRAMAKTPLTRSNMSKQEFIDLNIDQKNKKRILLWVDSFGEPQAPRYCAIWVPNPDRVAWNIDAVDEGDPDRQQRFEAMRAAGARPTLVAMTPAGRHCRMYTDTDIGKWDCRSGMTRDDYQARFDLNAKDGLWPINVSATGSGSGARFTAVFAAREETAARSFRATGGTGVPAIDAVMEAFTKDRNLRGTALAIGQGTRLLYARGYTFAEPGYPDIERTTLFRQASTSKTFCATAVWRLIQQGSLTLGTTLQSVLNLKQPNGTAPADSRFKDITVQHLLESRSGIGQGNIYSAVEASDAAGGTLPASGLEVARYVASQMLTGTPGDQNNTVYGNMDYMMLSLMVASKMGTPTFEAALKTLVLDPLEMSHTRGGRTRADQQLEGEARHHMTVHSPDADWPLSQLLCRASVKLDDQPLASDHYGSWDYEFLDGCGGLSSSVVDVARLCAMLSARNGNGVLDAGTLTDLLSHAYACRTHKDKNGNSSHGYHGMDWVSDIDSADDQWEFSKGGWLPGQGSSLTGTTGGYFYVYLQNGNTPAEATMDLWDNLVPVAEAHDWGSTDLFPGLGMPKFPTFTFKALKRGRIAASMKAARGMLERSMTPPAGRRLLKRSRDNQH